MRNNKSYQKQPMSLNLYSNTTSRSGTIYGKKQNKIIPSLIFALFCILRQLKNKIIIVSVYVVKMHEKQSDNDYAKDC